MKDELGGKIMTDFLALRAKMNAYRWWIAWRFSMSILWPVIKIYAKAQKSVWFLKALRLMTTRLVCLMVKR